MQIRIHNEGRSYFILSILITIISFPFSYLLGIFLLILTIYIFYFFRDPQRFVPVNDFIVSPADGVITYIGKSKGPELYKNKKDFIKISIFLNIFNVHVNRLPTDGTIKKIKYIPGKFINATLDKSSEDNERNIICIENKNKEIIYVTQIAGLMLKKNKLL